MRGASKYPMEARTPHFVCDFCGETYGKRDAAESSVFHLGTCDVCEDEHILVTSVSNFGGLYDTWLDGD